MKLLDLDQHISFPARKKAVVKSIPQSIEVTPKHCHKSEKRNAFITEAKKLGHNLFSLKAEVDHVREGFFFDHEIDHVPGMLTSCIVRQASLVVCHIFQDVGFDKKFVLTDVNTKFVDWAELDTPITIKCYLANMKYREGLSQTDFIADLYQGTKKIADGSAHLKIYPKHIYKKLRFRNQGDSNA